MSDLLPVKVERVISVSPTGEAVIVRPAPKKLSLGQRHAAWRIGLMGVAQFMKEKGFQAVMGDSTTHLGWYKGDFTINVSLREPANIAYVTSRYGVDPTAKRQVVGHDVTGQEIYGVTAQVTTLREVVGGRYVIMVEVSHTEGGTRNPIYVPLTETEDRPAYYVYRNVLGVLAMMCNTIPSLKAAFDPGTVRAAQEKELADAATAEDGERYPTEQLGPPE